MIHGYENGPGKIEIKTIVENRSVYIEVRDRGVGIADITQAMEPLFTTKPDEERSGMGFSFMEAFMDRLEVESKLQQGTVVKMWKEIGAPAPRYE